MSRNDALVLLFACAMMLSAFIGAAIWFSGENRTGTKIVEASGSPPVETQIAETLAYLKSAPRDGEALKKLGALYVEAGQLKEAVSAYVAAAIERPGDKEIRRAMIELQSRAQQKGKH